MPYCVTVKGCFVPVVLCCKTGSHMYHSLYCRILTFAFVLPGLKCQTSYRNKAGIGVIIDLAPHLVVLITCCLRKFLGWSAFCLIALLEYNMVFIFASVVLRMFKYNFQSLYSLQGFYTFEYRLFYHMVSVKQLNVLESLYPWLYWIW